MNNFTSVRRFRLAKKKFAILISFSASLSFSPHSRLELSLSVNENGITRISNDFSINQWHSGVLLVPHLAWNDYSKLRT